jgi:hypothetical protein
MRKLKGCQGYVAMTFLHVHEVTSHGDSDGGSYYCTLSARKDIWAPGLSDNHRLELTFTKGLLPDSKQDNIIQHNPVAKARDSEGYTDQALRGNSKRSATEVNLFFFFKSLVCALCQHPKDSRA